MSWENEVSAHMNNSCMLANHNNKTESETFKTK